MKIRIGVGAGGASVTPTALAELVRGLDELGFDPAKDFLLATGDMILGVQAAQCMLNRGGCRMLRWDGKYRTYSVYDVMTGEPIDER